jgi:hypothetical protein
VFGGFCLLLFLPHPWPPRGLGVVFLMPDFSGCLVKCFSDWPFWFCLESLILAQDERWRRA